MVIDWNDLSYQKYCVNFKYVISDSNFKWKK